MPFRPKTGSAAGASGVVLDSEPKCPSRTKSAENRGKGAESSHPGRFPLGRVKRDENFFNISITP